MDFFKLLYTKSKSIYIALFITSVLNGFSSIALLSFINNRIAGIPLPIFNDYDWLVFIGLLVGTFTLNKIFQTYMIRLTNEIIYEFQYKIHEKLKAAKLRQFENLGSPRVLTALNDVQHLGTLPEMVLSMLNAVITITACLAYIFWHSAIGALAILLVIVMLLTVYLLRNKWIENDMQVKRELENQYYRYMNDLLNGFKEIKGSFIKTFNIFERFMNVNLGKVRKIDEINSIRYSNNELSAGFSWYVVVGVLLFLGPSLLDLTSTTTSLFLVTILFMMGPMGTIVSGMQGFNNIKIVLSRQREFDSILDTILAKTQEAPQITELDKPILKELTIKAVEYNYIDNEKNISFKFGPIDCNVGPGELIFINGGNGSGKSTFVNLITGLYIPQSGHILINGVEISEKNFAFYSRYISSIFTSAYLFSENYENYSLDSGSEQLMHYIAMFKLENIIKFSNDGKVLGNKLSKGQQKRLAFIYALLEEKPLLILDEWAAEQDPEFRAYFYTVVIKKLQMEGKTLIMITHDDAYFHCADRIIKFDFGKITSDQTASPFVSKENSAINE